MGRVEDPKLLILYTRPGRCSVGCASRLSESGGTRQSIAPRLQTIGLSGVDFHVTRRSHATLRNELHNQLGLRSVCARTSIRGLPSESFSVKGTTPVQNVWMPPDRGVGGGEGWADSSRVELIKPKPTGGSTHPWNEYRAFSVRLSGWCCAGCSTRPYLAIKARNTPRA
jgi:hypothetical protein